jgi:hypothetical protein
MIHVPEAGTDGSAAGATKWFSMGSAAVPMGTQDKHDLLLRITPTRSTREEGDRQPQDVRTYPWQLSSARGHRTEELRYRAGPELGSSPSQLRTLLPDKWQCMGSFGDTSRQSYIQKSSQPHRAPAGWLVGHPLLPVARNRHRRRWLARNLDLPKQCSPRLQCACGLAFVCLATTSLPGRGRAFLNERFTAHASVCMLFLIGDMHGYDPQL